LSSTPNPTNTSGAAILEVRLARIEPTITLSAWLKRCSPAARSG
jgi:hypothetical protein